MARRVDPLLDMSDSRHNHTIKIKLSGIAPAQALHRTMSFLEISCGAERLKFSFEWRDGSSTKTSQSVRYTNCKNILK